MAQTYAATTLPGLEQALLQELKSFKIKRPRLFKGGVEFEATRRGFYQVVFWSRVANRVLLRMDNFRARDRHELYRKTHRIEWERLINDSLPIRIDSTSHNSRVFGSGDISNAVLNGIKDRLRDKGLVRPRVTQDKDELCNRIQVRLTDNQCSLSLDAGGLHLYTRGWRTTVGKAPLRESTAYALLRLLGWKPGDVILDPTCGSGTVVLEAARAALQLPPRLRESYALHHWGNFDSEVWEKAQAPMKTPIASDSFLYWGFDNHIPSVMRAQQNAATAEVGDKVAIAIGDIAQLRPPAGIEGGFLLSNPPYGERLPQNPEQTAESLLLERFQQEFSSNWTLGVLVPAEVSLFQQGLKAQPIAAFENGGLPVRFWKVTHRAAL